MLEQVRCAVANLESAMAGFEPGCMDGPAATKLVKVAARGKHMLGAIEALAAKRVDETGAYRASGARSAGHWLASTTGVPVAAAVKALETVGALGDLPATTEAFRTGRLSAEQAHEISGAASKDPSAERELLGVARDSSLKGLKDRCRLIRASAEADDAAWAKRLHDSRSLRQWVDSDGAACGIWRLAPDKGAAVKAALDAEADLIFREARRDGREESREAYAADAFHALMTRGPRKATAATLVIDETVPERGYALPGERCEITGIGLIPVTIAKAMLEDAKVRAVPRTGSELPEYSSDSRYYPPWLIAWLDARYPVCGAQGCDADFRLQYDHVVALADGGRTERDNLWRLCPHHHDLKTNHDWRITGTIHNWDLVPPDAPDPPDDPDPP